MAYIGKVPTAVPLTSADLEDNIITSAKIVDGTIATADISDGAVTSVKTTGVGGTNTPAFHAELTADQNIGDDVYTKIQFNSESFDTDNCYDNTTNYRFTPTTAGKYFVYGKAVVNDGANATAVDITKLGIFKNGTRINENRNDRHTGFPAKDTMGTVNAIVDMNGTTDYLELYALMDYPAGYGVTQAFIDDEAGGTIFGAYKLIT